MPIKLHKTTRPAKEPRPKGVELRVFNDEKAQRPMMAELYKRAEKRLRHQHKTLRATTGIPSVDMDCVRVLHELEVHQIELEMQNTELQKARDELEVALENYTDLYNFAPVGYFSINEKGVIVEANLMGASLLGIARSSLINTRLPFYVCASSRPIFMKFLGNVFGELKNQVCEVELQKQGEGSFWADFRAASELFMKGTQTSCRITFGDITARKEAEEAQRSLQAMTETNQELNREISRREAVEQALKKSKQTQNRMLHDSRDMQLKLAHMSHKILLAQEDERKQISHELHDEIGQTLLGISIHLEALSMEAAGDSSKGLRQRIARTQRLVNQSVEVVHQFALELRPVVLDDLGLVPALTTFLKSFSARTGVHSSLKACAEADELDVSWRTVLFRVAQEALTNVARHAHASKVLVTIKKNGDHIRMSIQDNGKSFQLDDSTHTNGVQRLGLLGMRERMEMVGGTFAIESKPGKGTAIIVEIPIRKKATASKKRLVKAG